MSNLLFFKYPFSFKLITIFLAEYCLTKTFFAVKCKQNLSKISRKLDLSAVGLKNLDNQKMAAKKDKLL